MTGSDTHEVPRSTPDSALCHLGQLLFALRNVGKVLHTPHPPRAPPRQQGATLEHESLNRVTSQAFASQEAAKYRHVLLDKTLSEESELLVTVRLAGNLARGVELDGCYGDTRIGDVMLRARTALCVPVPKEAKLRRGTRVVLDSETLAEVASSEGTVDFVVDVEGESGGMPVGCFGFGGQQTRDLRLHIQNLEVRFEAESRRHAEAEAQWKEAQQKAMDEVAHLKAEVESLQTSNAELHAGSQITQLQVQKLEAQLEAESRRHAEVEAQWKDDLRKATDAEAELKARVEALHRSSGQASGALAPVLLAKDFDFSAKVRNQITAGLQRRDDKYLNDFYQRWLLKSHTSGLKSREFSSALNELGVILDDAECQVLFKTMNVKDDGFMDFDGFKRAVHIQSPIEQLIRTLPVTEIIADAMRRDKARDLLRCFSETSTDQIKEICIVLVPFLESVLLDTVEKLKLSFGVLDKSKSSKGAAKFEVPQAMSAGTVEDFFGGLASRIGT